MSTQQKNLVESATVMINSLAEQKRQAGITVYNLSAGEPKLPPHPLIKQEAIEALNQGKTFYPPVGGLPQLIALATKWMKDTYHCHWQTSQCLVVNGGKLGIYLLLQHLLQPGDEVLIASPYWVSYPSITKLFGGKPIIIQTTEEEGFKLTEDALKKACTLKSKILILNNGCNPTGVLYTRQELERLLNIAKSNNWWVISDEVYSGLTYGETPYISCGEFSEYQERLAVIQSCSKNFSMTGWRVGFVFGPQNLIKLLTSLISQSTSGVTTISQWAAVGALKNAPTVNGWVKEIMHKRREVLLAAFQEFFGITLPPPPSSLYVFISLNRLGINSNSVEFCKRALEEANVAMVPGEAFGQEGYVRLSFGAEANELRLGIKSLANFVRNSDIKGDLNEPSTIKRGACARKMARKSTNSSK